jgi:hypothetical protein
VRQKEPSASVDQLPCVLRTRCRRGCLRAQSRTRAVGPRGAKTILCAGADAGWRVSLRALGHSHGSSVALKAVISPDLADVDVVCLSTPILCPVPRSALTESNNFIYLILFIPALAVFAFALQSDWPNGLVPFMVLLFCVPVLFALARYRHRAMELAKTIEVPEHRADRVLFVRFIGDEASLALGAFQALQYAMNGLIRAIVGVFSLFLKVPDWVGARLGWLGAIFFGPAFLAAAVYGYNGVNLWWLCIPVSAAFIGAFALLCLSAVLALLAFVTGLASIVVGIAPFGLRLATVTMWVEVCVEALPRGQWNALILETPAGFPIRGLRHSLGYEEARAIKAIIGHLNESQRH